MRAQSTRRVMRRKVVLVRTDVPRTFDCIAVAPPLINAGGDCEFTCAQCGKVLMIGSPSQLDRVVVHCQACEAFNTLGTADSADGFH